MKTAPAVAPEGRSGAPLQHYGWACAGPAHAWTMSRRSATALSP